MPRVFSVLLLLAWSAGLWWVLQNPIRFTAPEETGEADRVPRETLPFPEFAKRYLMPLLPVSHGFDYPLRPPNGAGVFVATPFWEEGSLGEDWNTAQKDKDLGEPVYSIGDGLIIVATDFESSYGKVIIALYRLPESDTPPIVEVMYSGLDTMDVAALQTVKRGQKIGTVGNVDGLFEAHLHWEVRVQPGLGLGGGFSEDDQGWIDPSEFVRTHRPEGATPGEMKVLPKNQRAGWGRDL